MRPFILRFAEAIPAVDQEAIRYDPARQVTQTLKDGQWVDRLTAPSSAGGMTRHTRVRAETTDDE